MIDQTSILNSPIMQPIMGLGMLACVVMVICAGWMLTKGGMQHLPDMLFTLIVAAMAITLTVTLVNSVAPIAPQDGGNGGAFVGNGGGATGSW